MAVRRHGKGEGVVGECAPSMQVNLCKYMLSLDTNNSMKQAILSLFPALLSDCTNDKWVIIVKATTVAMLSSIFNSRDVFIKDY